jgi:hypothetical protein
MIRFRLDLQARASSTAENIYFSRLRLLVIMAEAYVKGYPLGDLRRAAIRENADYIFYQALRRQDEKTGLSGSGDLLCQRAQLLALMARSFADGDIPEGHRRQALIENIDYICTHISEKLQLADVSFLKVA